MSILAMTSLFLGSICKSYSSTAQFYEEWMQIFDLCPVLAIHTDDLDFVNKPKHLDIVIQRIQDKLAGKEDVIFPANNNEIK